MVAFSEQSEWREGGEKLTKRMVGSLKESVGRSSASTPDQVEITTSRSRPAPAGSTQTIYGTPATSRETGRYELKADSATTTTNIISRGEGIGCCSYPTLESEEDAATTGPAERGSDNRKTTQDGGRHPRNA